MVYSETCRNKVGENECGNTVTITTSESGFKADGGNNSYTIKCGRCHGDVRTVSSSSLPVVSGGYAERDPY